MWIGCHHRSPKNHQEGCEGIALKKMWWLETRGVSVSEKDVKKEQKDVVASRSVFFVTMTLHQHNESAEWDLFMLLAHHWAFHMAQQCQEFPFCCQLQILEWSAIEWFYSAREGVGRWAKHFNHLTGKYFLLIPFFAPRAHTTISFNSGIEFLF